MAMKRKSLSASEIFRKQYKGQKNIMSPNIIKRGKTNKNVAFELSSGRGFDSGQVYGVTLVSVNKSGKTRPLYNKSKAFSSKSEAESYINRLKRMQKMRSKR